MASYRLQLFDRNNDDCARSEIEAESKLAAIIVAKGRAGKNSHATSWELWDGMKKLHTER